MMKTCSVQCHENHLSFCSLSFVGQMGFKRLTTLSVDVRRVDDWFDVAIYDSDNTSMFQSKRDGYRRHK